MDGARVALACLKREPNNSGYCCGLEVGSELRSRRRPNCAVEEKEGAPASPKPELSLTDARHRNWARDFDAAKKVAQKRANGMACTFSFSLLCRVVCDLVVIC